MEAKKLFERALSGYERVLGLNHESTLMAVSNLATVLYKQGRLEEAKKLYERALAGFTRVLGPNNEQTKAISKILSLINQLLN